MDRNFRPTAFAFSLAVIFASACATAPPSPAKNAKGPQKPAVGKKAKPSPDSVEFRDIQTLFSKSAFDAAIIKSVDFENKYQASPSLSQVENLHGLALLLTKKPGEAELYFQKSLEHSAGNKNFSQYVLYNLASAQAEIGHPDAALATLDKMEPDLLDSANKLKFFQLRAQIRTKKEDHLDAAKEMLAATKSGLPTGPSSQGYAGLPVQLQQSLEKVRNTLALEDLYQKNENHPYSDIVLLEIIRKHVNENNLQKAGEFLGIMQRKFPQSALLPQATQLVYTQQGTSASTAAAAPVNPQAIGVLLPLKGRFSKFGYRTLQGIELAFRIFNETEPDSQVTLVVEDSGEEPEQALAALTRLVQQHHVVAVIGPLLSKGSEQISQKAQELAVPLLSLARHAGNAISDYTIQSGLSMKLQTEAVAKYAVERLNLKKFAILAPQDKAGQESARLFWDAVEANGAEVVGFEGYTPGETDFRQPVDKLSGLYYTDARQRELEALAKQREELKIRKKNRKTEQYFNLKPIVDYEAVFVPDEPRVSGQVLPTFAYRDVDKMRFLGTSAWNSPEFVTRAQAAAEGSFFADAFSLESPSPGAKPFIEKYRATFGQDPTTMEALSYDAARIIEYALQHGAKNRLDILEKIKDIRNFPGITGTISYLDGQLTRQLEILTVQGGKIVSAK